MTRIGSRTLRSSRRNARGGSPKGPAPPIDPPSPVRASRVMEADLDLLLGTGTGGALNAGSLHATCPTGTTHRHAAQCYGAPSEFGTNFGAGNAVRTGGSIPSVARRAAALGIA